MTEAGGAGVQAMVVPDATTVVQAVLDAMAARVAILDGSGDVIAINQAWRRAAAAEGAAIDAAIGQGYPAMCDEGPPLGSTGGREVADAIRAVLRGETELREVDYPSDGDAQERWYMARISAIADAGDFRVMVALEDTTADRCAERRRQHQQGKLVGVDAAEGEQLAGETVSRIRAALREQRMVLFAQPIVCLETGRTVQHELLIRMRSEHGDLVPPCDFLPVAEAYGLIREIDRYVIREAMAFAGAGSPVELNLSADSLSDPSLLGYVQGELAAYGVDPSLVVFEITETALMANETSALEFVTGVAELGCAVALDDFGTGYGSLHYVKHLPVRYLKIDREFVTDILLGGADQHVIDAIVSLARALGQLTVAEGVEDAATLGRLRELGIDQAQGWALGRPVPIEDVYPSRVERSNASSAAAGD